LKGSNGVNIFNIFFILAEPNEHRHLPIADPEPDRLLGLHMLVKILIIA
jgi:hypothetical protein